MPKMLLELICVLLYTLLIVFFGLQANFRNLILQDISYKLMAMEFENIQHFWLGVHCISSNCRRRVPSSISVFCCVWYAVVSIAVVLSDITMFSNNSVEIELFRNEDWMQTDSISDYKSTRCVKSRMEIFLRSVLILSLCYVSFSVDSFELLLLPKAPSEPVQNAGSVLDIYRRELAVLPD